MKARHVAAMLAIGAGAVGVGATAAFAVPGASSAPPATQVVGTGGTQPSTQTPTLPEVQASATPSAPSGSSLPLTGGDVAGLTVIGLALVGGGAVVVRRARVRASD